MAQRTKSSKENAHQEKQAAAEEEIEELQPMPSQGTLYENFYTIAEKFATMRIGQFVMSRGDRALKVIENTAKWSLPQADKTDCKLERPLPWMPFFALIIMLRWIRMWASVVAFLIGNGPVTPEQMIYFVQTRRRKLRALRVNGMKEIRQREMEANASKSVQESEVNVIAKLMKLFSSAICRPGQHREPGRRIFVYSGRERNEQEDDTCERKTTKRPRDEEIIIHGITVHEMLTKFANENSEDDSDFIPTVEEESNGEETTSSASSISSDETEAIENEHQKDHTTSNEQQQQQNAVQAHDDNSMKQNAGITIKENGGHEYESQKQSRCEYTKEPMSDTDSGNADNLTPTGNGPSNGDERRDVDVVHCKKPATAFTYHKLNVTYEDDAAERKFTAGHSSATKVKLPSLGATAAVGSPPDFNASFKPVSILKNATVLVDHTVNAQSIPTMDFGMDRSGSVNNVAESTAYPFNVGNLQQQQQQQRNNRQYQSQHSYPFQHKYRGRNRR